MATAGKTSVGASTDFNGNDDGSLDGPYTTGASATITAFHIYMRWTTGATALIRPLIYADSGGEPGSLIATLAEISMSDTTPQWRDLTGLSVNTGAATDIWIGLWYNNSQHRYYYDAPGGTPGRYKSVLATYSSSGDAPSTWPTASDTNDTQEHSCYVDYTAGAAADATPPLQRFDPIPFMSNQRI